MPRHGLEISAERDLRHARHFGGLPNRKPFAEFLNDVINNSGNTCIVINKSQGMLQLRFFVAGIESDGRSPSDIGIANCRGDK